MVFMAGLAAITAIAPPAAVVTAPLMQTGATGAAVAAATGTAVGAASTVGAAAGVATATGTALATGTAGTALIGTTAGATGSLLGATAASMGPPGWIMLGKSECSWSCWKKIIHDESDNGDGVSLAYILQHDSVKLVWNHENYYNVENIWGEKFKIYFVELPNGDIAAHAE